MRINKRMNMRSRFALLDSILISFVWISTNQLPSSRITVLSETKFAWTKIVDIGEERRSCFFSKSASGNS